MMVKPGSTEKTAAVTPTRRVRPRHAASLVLLRADRRGLSVLMGRRGLSARFMPGFYVCPGGRVAADDHERWVGETGEPATASGSAFRRLARAALRETFEETGILLGSPTATDPAAAR